MCGDKKIEYVNVYRADIEGKGGVEIYVVSAEEPTVAIQAGVRRYQSEHMEGTALRCKIYTLDGELLLEKFLREQG